MARRTTLNRTHRVTCDIIVARDILTSTLITKSVTASALPVGDEFFVLSVLSLPIKDHAGDIVRPAGLTYKAHQRSPSVDFEHGFDPTVGRQIVGWARKSLDKHSPEYCRLDAELDVPTVGKAIVPIGGTYFDRNNQLQRQVCWGVRDGSWPAVSLEFLPDMRLAKSLGQSPLERRDAYDFGAADVVRWTHCVRPVCPGAQTVLKALPPELDALGKVLRDKQIRGEQLHPHILKSLARYVPTSTTVPVRLEKAMTPQNDPETVYDPEMPDQQQGDGMDDGTGDAGGPAMNGVSALYSHAQALVAAAQQLEQDMQTSDSPQLRAMGKKLMQQVVSIAQAAKGTADKHDAMLNGGGDLGDLGDLDGMGDDDTDTDDGGLDGDDSDLETDDGTDTEGDESGDAESDGDGKGKKKPPFAKKALAPDMSLDADGVFAKVRDVYRPILKAIPRYSLDDITRGVAAAQKRMQPAPEPEPEPEDAELKALLADVAKERQRLQKTRRNYT